MADTESTVGQPLQTGGARKPLGDRSTSAIEARLAEARHKAETEFLPLMTANGVNPGRIVNVGQQSKTRQTPGPYAGAAPTTEVVDTFVVSFMDSQGNKTDVEYAYDETGGLHPTGDIQTSKGTGPQKEIHIEKDGDGNTWYYDPEKKDWFPFGVPNSTAEDRASQRTVAEGTVLNQATANVETGRHNRAQEALTTSEQGLTADQIALKKQEQIGYTDTGLPTLAREQFEETQKTNEFTQTVKFPWDVARENADAQRDQLRIQVANGTLTLEQAKQQFVQWKEEHIDTPFKQSQEARLNATETRLRQSVQDEAEKARADTAIRRAQVGQTAAQTAVGAAESLLPYSVGETFGPEMASGINSLAKGSAAGVNFSPGAFNFQAPNFSKIATQAAANATKGISPYARKIVDPNWLTDLPAVPQIDFSQMPALPDMNLDMTGMTNANQSLQDVMKSLGLGG